LVVGPPGKQRRRELFPQIQLNEAQAEFHPLNLSMSTAREKNLLFSLKTGFVLG